MKSALIIAFHFPPVAFSSGVHRTHKLVQYLPENGWRPLVVAPSPRAYERVTESVPAGLPDCTVVRRSFALDTARHLSIAGRYVSAMALPDRWVSWFPAALLSALALTRQYRPQVLWSTYPIATTHVVAMAVKRLTGLPWVADFRDPMTEEGHPRDPRVWRMYRSIERRTLERCDLATFVTEGCRRVYEERYGPELARKFRVVENGYDEADFEVLESSLPPYSRIGERVTLLHAGILYPEERDPRPLFSALGRLSARGVLSAASFRLVLRASGHEQYHEKLIADAGIADLVTLEAAIPYADALREMMRCDGLLLMQGANCNEQIPAKAYEYLRSGRPILALATPVGDTGRLLTSLGVEYVCPMEDTQAIEDTVERFVAAVAAGSAKGLARESIALFARRDRCRAMAGLFDSLGATCSLT